MQPPNPADDPGAAYRRADRRLRDLLLGDGLYAVGLVRGDEARQEVTRELRKMRDALDALAASGEARAEKAEARVADLEQALLESASAKARGSRGPRKRSG